MNDIEKLFDACVALLAKSSVKAVERFYELHPEPEFKKLKGTVFDVLLAFSFSISAVDAILRNLPDVPSDK